MNLCILSEVSNNENYKHIEDIIADIYTNNFKKDIANVDGAHDERFIKPPKITMLENGLVQLIFG